MQADLNLCWAHMSNAMFINCGSTLFVIQTVHLILILLFMTTPSIANSVDPDQMASEEMFVIQFVNLSENII